MSDTGFKVLEDWRKSERWQKLFEVVLLKLSQGSVLSLDWQVLCESYNFAAPPKTWFFFFIFPLCIFCPLQSNISEQISQTMWEKVMKKWGNMSRSKPASEERMTGRRIRGRLGWDMKNLYRVLPFPCMDSWVLKSDNEALEIPPSRGSDHQGVTHCCALLVTDSLWFSFFNFLFFFF